MDKIMVPAGKYYLGDPCYSFTHKKWGEILDDSQFLDEVYKDKKGRVVAFGTACGDGVYEDQYGNSYPVDAGMIGLVSEKLANRKMDGRLLVTFRSPVECYTSGENGGVLHFGEYVIDTIQDGEGQLQ